MAILPEKKFLGEDEVSLGRKHFADHVEDLVFPSISCLEAVEFWNIRANPSPSLILLWGHLADTMAEHQIECPIHDAEALSEIRTILLG